MKLLTLLITSSLMTHIGLGQFVFTLKNSSSQYDAMLFTDSCDNSYCSGKGKVQLISKGTQRVFQTLYSDNLFIELESKSKAPLENVNLLYDGQSAVFFEDYNFDGSEDLAIRNGNESGYGGPSYDVYVFNKTKKQFVLSSELTALVSDNLGMFRTDKKRKRLTTFAKSGCCWHIMKEYSVVPKKGLVKVYELEEDATKSWVLPQRELMYF